VANSVCFGDRDAPSDLNLRLCGASGRSELKVWQVARERLTCLVQFMLRRRLDKTTVSRYFTLRRFKTEGFVKLRARNPQGGATPLLVRVVLRAPETRGYLASQARVLISMLSFANLELSSPLSHQRHQNPPVPPQTRRHRIIFIPDSRFPW
jgi:hypothetical protein